MNAAYYGAGDMTHEDPALNPYLSPRTDSANAQVLGEPWFGNYHPVVMPRDAADVIVSGGCGIILALFIYGLPFIVLYLLQAPAIAFGTTTLVIVCIAVLAMFVGIHRIELTPEGIVAVRKLMRPLRISWKEVNSVEIASRSAVMLATVFLPHRCCSYSMTSRDQTCIRTGRIRILFPAHDSLAFCTTATLAAAQHNPNFRPTSTQSG